MSNTNEQFVFDPAGVSLIADITEDALRKGRSLGVAIPSNDEEARHQLGKRIIRAIEAGEMDMLNLRDHALLPTLD
jgi:hypothetical protein